MGSWGRLSKVRACNVPFRAEECHLWYHTRRVAEHRSHDRNLLHWVYAGSRRRTMIRLSFGRASHHFGLCEWGHTPGCAPRLKTLVGKVANFLRVYRMCHDTPCFLAKNYDRRERNSMKFSQPVKADGYMFSKLKLTFSKNLFSKTCIGPWFHDPRL
jgi:hypothetical protein